MSDKVNNVWQDEEGYIWVVDEVGFSRINGEEVVNFRPEMGKVVNESFTYQKDGKFYFEGGCFDGSKYSTQDKIFDSEEYITKEFNLVYQNDTLTDLFEFWGEGNINYKVISDRNSGTSKIVSINGDTVSIGTNKQFNTYNFNLDSLIKYNKFYSSFEGNALKASESLRIYDLFNKIHFTSNSVLIQKTPYDNELIEYYLNGDSNLVSFNGVQLIKIIVKDKYNNYYVISYDSNKILYFNHS